LLEGFYEDWALRERERLRDLYLRSLAHLMYYYGRCQQFEQGIACGQQILRHDPLREEIHRHLMRLFATSGQRSLAVRQYETCCNILQLELAIPPMEETQLLLAELAPELGHAGGESSRAGSPTAQPATIDQALHQLRAAMHHLQDAQAELSRAADLVAQIHQRR
jgi:DNA-binding SARP family transcriptional activator